jgi:diguanylate cyclase (GGDEF)-like protein
VRVTGICITEDTNPFSGQVPFDILMRSLDDIQVVQGPPLLSTRNLILLVGFLLVVIAAIGGWGWRLERKLHRHTAAVAAVEQIRGSILEDINGSRPLVEILEKIVGMTSEALEGVPCWCELADGSAVGDVPPQPHNLQVVRMRIDGRSGPALGSLFAALGAQSLPPAARKKALTDGVRLTSLAIETRRLYSDLRRRSEFDLLTDIPNRFAMDKRLNLLIEEASHNGSVFGLIYIDLDKFKPINDRYGHHIGDLYLQEAAVRMMRQLRGGDMLARLGGDEFAALVSVAHSREDVVEAAHRLERCFEEPFAVGEYSLRGTASFGIALYPADGASKDSLLSAADAAMYAVKNLKKQLQIFSG